MKSRETLKYDMTTSEVNIAITILPSTNYSKEQVYGQHG